MNYSVDRLMAMAKDKIDKSKLSPQEKESRMARFTKRIVKVLGAGKGAIINDSYTRCFTCGQPINRVAGQLTKYCSKQCRKERPR